MLANLLQSVPVKYIIMQSINVVAYKYGTQTRTNKLYIMTNTRTHTLSIMHRTHVLTNSFHCTWSRAWIRVQVSPLHTDTKDGLKKGEETHHTPHSSIKQSFRSNILSYILSHFTHSGTLPIPHTHYVLLPLEFPTHICGVLPSLPRPVEGEENTNSRPHPLPPTSGMHIGGCDTSVPSYKNSTD